MPGTPQHAIDHLDGITRGGQDDQWKCILLGQVLNPAISAKAAPASCAPESLAPGMWTAVSGPYACDGSHIIQAGNCTPSGIFAGPPGTSRTSLGTRYPERVEASSPTRR